MDAPDDQYVFLKFNFTDCFAYEVIIRSINVTRFQRASEGAGQSTSSSRDNVIQRRGVRFQNFWRNLVVLSDSPVDSEYHRRCLCRQVCFSNWSLHPFDSNFGTIDNLGHQCSLPRGPALPPSSAWRSGGETNTGRATEYCTSGRCLARSYRRLSLEGGTNPFSRM